jgi:hypothetical protein
MHFGEGKAELFPLDENVFMPGSLVGGSLKNRDNKLFSRVPLDLDLRKAALVIPGKN